MTPSPSPHFEASRAETSNGPRIGVVTVTYRSDEVLPNFLESLSRASAEEIAVVVTDNAPDQGSARAQSATAGATYLPLPHNPGYGSAANAGERALPDSVEWVLIANPDVTVSPGALDTLRAAGDADPSIAAVGPAVLNEDGTVYPSARAVPSLRTGVGHALFANLWHENPWTRRYRNDTDTEPVARDAGWLSGSCLLIRRSAYRALGGFDEAYFMYFEDVDLGYRIGKAGWRNRYEPAAQVTHLGAHSTTSESARMIRAHHDSAKRFLRQKYAGWWLWPVRVALSVGLAARSAWVARRAERTQRTG